MNAIVPPPNLLRDMGPAPSAATISATRRSGLAFREVENGPDPCVAMGRDEGARPFGDGVA